MTRCRVRIGLYPFQSTLPARGATTLSICTPPVVEYFNPRSPHGERPPYRGGWKKSFSFQSTLPARGATSTVSDTAHASTHFNPRSPHGERRDLLTTPKQPKEFQSTLPTRGATAEEFGGMGWVLFQSTLPTRGATSLRNICITFLPISIHAPHTGSDGWTAYFARIPAEFQSTLPTRGATIMPTSMRLESAYFNPRSPHGERRIVRPNSRPFNYFNPRSPHGERHARNSIDYHEQLHFNPRSPHGERLMQLIKEPKECIFQSTLPTRGATAACCSRSLLR